MCLPRGAGVAAFLLSALLSASPASAEAGTESEGWSFRLSTELMSPYCPGRTLADCPSAQAEELRRWIREQEEEGRSEQQVSQQLFARFGDVILQAPRPRGFGLAAYAIPALAVLVGGSIVFLFLRRQGRGAFEAAREPPDAPVDPELERVVDEELERSGP